jgi:hypothetical protein
MRPGTDIFAAIVIAAALMAATSPGWRLPLPQDAPTLVRLGPAASRSAAFELLGGDGREPRRADARTRQDTGRNDSR